MIIVRVKGTFDEMVELEDIGSFDEIDEDNMSIEESNKLINEAVFKRYGIYLNDITVF